MHKAVFYTLTHYSKNILYTTVKKTAAQKLQHKSGLYFKVHWAIWLENIFSVENSKKDSISQASPISQTVANYIIWFEVQDPEETWASLIKTATFSLK